MEDARLLSSTHSNGGNDAPTSLSRPQQPHGPNGHPHGNDTEEGKENGIVAGPVSPRPTINTRPEQDSHDGRHSNGPSGGGDGPSLAASNTPSGQGGRLSTGAIAGIAVGAILAIILLVAGLAWLLLRRRRQKQREAARAAARLASKTSVEDKDIHPAHVADPPRSLYSDVDASLPGRDSSVSPLAAGEGADVALHSSHLGAGAGAGAGDDDHAQTQRGVPHSVAHLVEEGMTAEEIRRLEDEERQLDAEIERAARR